MNTLVLRVAAGQLDQVEGLAKTFQDYGPWALLVITLLAIAWLAKAYVAARDERDKAVSDLNEKLTGLLKDMVTAAEQQKAANEKVVDLLDRIERRLEQNVQPRQG